MVPNKNQVFHRIFNLRKVEAPPLQVCLNSVGLPCSSLSTIAMQIPRAMWIQLGKPNPDIILSLYCVYLQHIWDVRSNSWACTGIQHFLLQKATQRVFDIYQLCRWINWGKDWCDPGDQELGQDLSHHLVYAVSQALGNSCSYWPVLPAGADLSSVLGWAKCSEIPDTAST